MKYKIEVEGLPEGWKVISYRKPKRGEKYFHQGIIWDAYIDEAQPFLIVEKIQPRRIVLELTEEECDLMRKIPIEQRLLNDPAMPNLLKKIKSAEVK